MDLGKKRYPRHIDSGRGAAALAGWPPCFGDLWQKGRENAPGKCPIKLFPGSENGRPERSAAVHFSSAAKQCTGDLRKTLRIFPRARREGMLLTSRQVSPAN